MPVRRSRRAERLMRNFGNRLRAVRIARGYQTAEEMAQALKIEGPRYRSWERGGSIPHLDLLEDVRKLTGVSLDFLLLGITDPPSPEKEGDGTDEPEAPPRR